MYKKIVVPVDMGQLEKGEKILAKALALLDQGGSLVLVNVVESVPTYLTIDLPVDFIDASVKDAEEKLAALSTKLSASAKQVVRVGSPAREIIEMDVPQSVAQFGHRGFPRKDDDFIAAYILNYIIGGGGFSSRLMEEVREKRGLAYSVHSNLFPYKHGAVFVGNVATQNERVGQSLEVI